MPNLVKSWLVISIATLKIATSRAAGCHAPAEDVNMRQPLKLITIDRYNSGEPVHNCGLTPLRLDHWGNVGTWMEMVCDLVGGLEHVACSHIWGIIIPADSYVYYYFSEDLKAPTFHQPLMDCHGTCHCKYRLVIQRSYGKWPIYNEFSHEQL